MIAPIDLPRHAKALEAADDPGAILDEATEAFGTMTAHARTGNHQAVRLWAVITGDLCLRLCATRATRLKDAQNKQRLLAIMIRWAWVREPALGAVLDAAWRAEEAIWGMRPSA